jgi:6-phosphogluconolactonase
MAQALWKNELTRRDFTGVFTAFALSAGLCSTHIYGAAAAKNTPADLVYVGTDGGQIYAMRFDPNTGQLTMLGAVAEVPKPRWSIAHPQLPVLYAASDESSKEGTVIAFAVDHETGALAKMNALASGGSGPTHLWLDIPSMSLFAANFGAGSVSSMAINPDGSLGLRVSTIKATGSGPHRRQASPHAHGITIDPSGRYALVSDLGADRVFVYGFDRAAHALLPDDVADPRAFVAPAGSGPRRTVFGMHGRFVYVLNELSAEIMALRWDAAQGRLSHVQSLPTSSPEFQGSKSGSEIALGHDGRFLYAGDRGEHTLLVYRIHPDSGEISLVQRTASGGDLPWSFAIHPSGKWMLVANQRSSNVSVFSIDPTTGMLSNTGPSVTSPTPISLSFMQSKPAARHGINAIEAQTP